VIGIFTDTGGGGTGTIISGDEPSQQQSSPASQPAAPVGITDGVSFTVQGEPDAPSSIPNLFDGDPSTDWSTYNYFQQLGPNGINTGTGAVLTLERPTVLQQVVVNSPSPGTKVEIRQVDGTPSMDSKLLGSAELKSGDTPIKLQASTPSNKILVVLTKLSPGDGGNFASKINEISVTGSSA
jgi:hypothetical protein